MTFKYPKFTKTSFKKVSLILLLDIVSIAFTLIIAVHGTWKSMRWKLLNGHYLDWDVGLLSVDGGVDCSAINEPGFYATCMAVFKNTFGSLKSTQQFLCSLDTAPLKIETQFIDEVRFFRSSCDDARYIYIYSCVCLTLLLLSAMWIVAGFLIIMRFSYKKFAYSIRQLYWWSLGTHICGCVFLVLCQIFYSFTISSYLMSIFACIDDLNPSTPPIIPSGPSWNGAAFWASLVLLAQHILIIGLVSTWVPVLREEKFKPASKKSSTRHAKREESQQSEKFWAYMPEVFQPNTYVTEANAPELIG